MTNDEATVVTEAMASIPYFPTERAARALIADELVSMCQTVQQGMWLARRYGQVFQEWKGIGEMRAVFCGRYRPKDGLEGSSAIFLDGIPSERPSEAPASRALPPAGSEARKILDKVSKK